MADPSDPALTPTSSSPPDWTGEDATLGGGSASLTPRSLNNSAEISRSAAREPRDESSAVAPAWRGDDITVGGGSGPITPLPTRKWTGDEMTQGGGMGKSEAPASPESPTAGARPSRASSDRLRQAGGDRAIILEALRRKDAAWLDEGRAGVLSGKTLGDFLVGKILGEGGMAVVYRARQVSLDRRVALKVLPPAMVEDPVLMERFAGEAHTAGLLVSPNVVQVYFAGNIDEQVFFAMEFVSGTDLAHIISRQRSEGKPLPVHQAGRYVAQAAHGLAEAERNQIVHRDIKPQNLLLTSDDMVKIADFGIAKVMGEHHLTLTGSAVGTPAYCSPEQGRGDAVDQRSDLYSLGVVFYELLTGQKPFAGTQANQLIYQHNFSEPKPPRSLRPDVPEAYETVCMRLMMKDPEQRYQHAADLAADVESLIAGGRVQAPPFEIRFGTGAQVAIRKHLGRRRWIPWTIAATLAVAASVALWLGNQALEADEVVRRRGRLAILDQVASVPRSSSADLAWISKRLGKTQGDVLRWQNKLDQVETLRGRLARLDADEKLPEASLRQASETDLAGWETLVGSSDPDAVRWHARIQAAQDDISRLRIQLAELDRSDPLTVAVEQRLRPPFQRLVHLAGHDDAEVQRWQSLLDRQGQSLKAQRAALTALTGPAPVSEARLKMLRHDWRQYLAMVGDQDKDAALWGRQLDLREVELKRLRDTIARLDRVELVTTSLQAEVRGDLDVLAALLPLEDPQMAAWRAKIFASNQRIAALRQSLGALLDVAGHLDAGALTSCQRQLAEYRAMVSPDDGRLVAWERRLVKERQDVQDLQTTLLRLEQETPMTLAEQAACRRAIEELTQRDLLGADRRSAGERRLAGETARIVGLRAQLAEADRPGAGLSAGVIAAVAALTTATGGADAELRRWQERLAEYHRRHAALEVLDRVAPLPVDTTRLLAAYAELVPATDPDLGRWQAKVLRISEVLKILAPLGRVEPPPNAARAWLDELEDRLIGAQNPVVVAGRAKLDRLDELKVTLGILGRAQALPLDWDLEAALAAWVGLVGTSDKRWLAWDRRIRQLKGPGKPAWAFNYGRDAHGLWADVAVKSGQLQRMRFIPGGSMRLGSPVDEAGRDSDETPPRDEAVRSFWLADSECPQSLYADVCALWPSRNRAPERPVESVTRADALHFCEGLSKTVAGAEVRLPSEREWEYASRSGAEGPYSGPLGPVERAHLGEIAWFGRSDAPRPGRLLQPNRFGLYDCHGNVWEWVADRYLSGDGRESGEDGVARGGSWSDRAELLRAANRLPLAVETRSTMVGFRFAISALWPEGREPGFETVVPQAEAKEQSPEQAKEN